MKNTIMKTETKRKIANYLYKLSVSLTLGLLSSMIYEYIDKRYNIDKE